jgi:hypothetical protein
MRPEAVDGGFDAHRRAAIRGPTALVHGAADLADRALAGPRTR